jgi:hypothetical protein
MDNQDKINVKESKPIEYASGKVGTRAAHDRSRAKMGKRQPTEAELKARSEVASATSLLSQEDTTTVYFEPVENFNELSTPFQMATIATIADVPWAAGGPPGTGKTVSANEIGEGLGLIVKTVRAGASMQSDFDGIPAVVGEAGQEEFKRMHPNWAHEVKDQNAMVFLDEINRASMDVQNACLNLVSGRELEGMKLGKGVRVAAAFNPEDDGITEFSEALRRRFMFIDWKNDDQAQLDHFSTRSYKTFNTSVVAGRIPTPEDFVDSNDRWAHIAAGFHARFPGQHLHEPPKDGEDPNITGYGYPNKGSWESAFRLLSVAEALGAPEGTKQNLVQACVGNVAGAEFWGYQKDLDLPDPEALLANPTSYVRPDRDDKVFAVSSSVVAAVEKNPTSDRWTQAVSIMCRMVDDNGDVGAEGLKRLVAMKKKNPDLKGAKMPAEEVKKFSKLLRDSGIIQT